MHPNPRVVLPVVLVLAGLGAGGWFWTHRGTADLNTLHVSGTIEAVTAEVGFRQPGRVARRLVSEGDAVKADQPLALLDDTPLREDVAQREADLHAAQAALADLAAGARPAEIAQAAANARRAYAALAALQAGARQQDVEAARQALDRTRVQAAQLAEQARRVEALYGVGGISVQERDAQKASADAAEAARREAAARLALLQAGSRPEDIAQARAAASQADAALALAREGSRPGQLAQAKARVELAEAAVAQARTRLGDARLAAPFAGVVLAHHVEPGEIVAAGTPVVTLGKLADTYLEAYVAESDMGRVRAGQTATVTIDGMSGRGFGGHVTFIASQAEFTPKSVQTEKERVKLVYRIKIDVPNPDFTLKPGMPADAAIAVASGAR